MRHSSRSATPLHGPEGQQGDVEIFRIPDAVMISTDQEIRPKGDRLIISEGELTGHHHAIWLQKGSAHQSVADSQIEGVASQRRAAAHLYRDPDAIATLVNDGKLLRDDLAIGILIVEGGVVTLCHEEHDGIQLEPGRYYVGRQVEGFGAYERKVQD